MTQPPTAPGSADASAFALVPFRHGGEDRPYLLHVPDRREPMPLLVELHGRGIDPVRFDRLTGFRSLADERGFILALPAGRGEIWNDGRDARAGSSGPDDVAYLLDAVEHISTRAPIDGRRVYMVGMSNGAAMAGRVACEHPERLAAFAQVAGTAAAEIVTRSRPSSPLPILQIHGSADPYAPYTGGVRRGLRAHIFIRHAWGPSIGVNAWARFWVDANRAAEGPDVMSLPPDATARTWHGATPASDVVFYRIEGGGHTWPNGRVPLARMLFGRTSRTLDATGIIWDFLAGHSRAE